MMLNFKRSLFFYLFICFSLISCETDQSGQRAEINVESTEKKEWAIVIHGGAGTMKKDKMSAEQQAEYHAYLKMVLSNGKEMLNNGETALDVVESCIQLMEESELFNAGKGAVFTHEGKNELDASIMNGSDLNAGAVAGVSRIKSPISAARLVLEESPHVMLSGVGAELFAEEKGEEMVDSSYFFTKDRFESLQKAKEREAEKTEKYGTVGVVCLDKEGNLAAGTSTGGMTNKRWGRIGDSPIIGAGTYANNKSCAVSATGHGEYFIRAAVAHEISALMLHKELSVEKACEKVVMHQLVEMGGDGGVIALDKNGNHSMTFNTDGMYRGYANSSGELESFIFR